VWRYQIRQAGCGLFGVDGGGCGCGCGVAGEQEENSKVMEALFQCVNPADPLKVASHRVLVPLLLDCLSRRAWAAPEVDRSSRRTSQLLLDRSSTVAVVLLGRSRRRTSEEA
jgi:hypothetical protein